MHQTWFQFYDTVSHNVTWNDMRHENMKLTRLMLLHSLQVTFVVVVVLLLQLKTALLWTKNALSKSTILLHEQASFYFFDSSLDYAIWIIWPSKTWLKTLASSANCASLCGSLSKLFCQIWILNSCIIVAHFIYLEKASFHLFREMNQLIKCGAAVLSDSMFFF